MTGPVAVRWRLPLLVLGAAVLGFASSAAILAARPYSSAVDDARSTVDTRAGAAGVTA